jgi:hypothetical protein
VRIAELPFHERPVMELLGFVEGRAELDHDYAGYGWARVPQVWLVDDHGERTRMLEDALLLALHSPDDGESIGDDIELEFELPDKSSVLVLLSDFLREWLPKLPQASSLVLVLCNPHRARIHAPVPLWLADGDVEAWVDEDDREPRILLAAETWYTLPS